MENARIVKLGSGESPITVSFEEAFGEHSEFRGRGRARRRKRRLERVKNRAEVRAARRKARMEAMEDRQEKRSSRKKHRIDRRNIGKEQDDTAQEMDNNTAAETQDSAPVSSPQEGESQTTENSDISAGEQEASSDESSNEGSGYSDDIDSTEQSDESDESGFDGSGRKLPDGMFCYSNADGEKVVDRINPKVRDIARKIEWNKEKVSRLEKRLANAPEDKKEHIQNEIEKHKKRVIELEQMTSSFCNASGKNRRRNAEVRAAKKAARKERRQVRKQARVEKKAARYDRKHGGDVTPVESDLNPDIENNKIEVPAEEASSFNGKTGLISLDSPHDIDAPQVRNIELKSNANGTGSTSKINLTQVVIGVGIGALAFYLYKKYKHKLG